MSLLDLTLAELASRIEEDTLTVRTLIEAALERHDAVGPRLGAYKTFGEDRARLEADARDRARKDGREVGALQGIPISAKDLYGVEDFPTFAGTSHRLPEAFEHEGFLVQTLRREGAVFVGKSHTVEMAFGGVGTNPHWGTPWNPWDAKEARIPGGSSCGAGVSLAEGSALLALGTDTGGSIRIPASMTGVVGQKLTRGRWSTTGVVPLSTTLDTVGLLARSVADLAFAYHAIDPYSAGDPPPPPTRDLADLRVGVPTSTIWEETAVDVAAVVRSALEELEAAGAQLVEVDGALFDEATRRYFDSGIVAVECAAFLDRVLPRWWDRLHPSVGRRVSPAREISGPAYVNALEARLDAATRALAWWDAVDVLAVPTVPITPPPVEEVEDAQRYVEVNRACLRATTPASYLDLCALSLPVGLDAAGMPVGLQLIGAGGEDNTLLDNGLRVERVLGRPHERIGRPPAI